jgi:CRISPR-associated endonuclease Csn1
MSARPLRYAFDLGTNSIGWAVYRLDRDPADAVATVCELVGAGVRIISQGIAEAGRDVKGASLAEARRGPRSARKRRDRFVMRRATLIKQLTDFGLLPYDPEARRALASLDPYRLRAEGLDRRLEPHEIGRALLHINQRRGFRSNRRADRKAKPDDQGKIATAIAKLDAELAALHARTFGEYLWRRHGGTDGQATPRTRQSVRIRAEGEGTKALYAVYPSRQMLIDEFDALLASQAAHHSELLPHSVIADIRETIFHQRPLKPVEVGRCTFVPEERRLPRALPSVEARVIYETLNQLRFGKGLTLQQKLSAEQRDLLAQALIRGENVTFRQLRKLFGLSEDIRVSLEEGGKKDFDDFRARSASLAWRKLKGKERQGLFGERWFSMSLSERDDIVNRLIDTDDENAVVKWLTTDYMLNEEAARAVAAWLPQDGYARLGRTANNAVLAELKAPDLPTHSEAVERAGWHHSDERDGVIELRLPYYGQVLERHVLFGSGDLGHDPIKRYGRFPNPTAHIALNQLRRIVNLFANSYGPPSQIVIELARDLKMNKEQKDDAKKKNRDDRAVRDRLRAILAEHSQHETGDNFLRLRLHEEQLRADGVVARYPFSLKPIEIRQLFSSEIEIEHILPWSRTFDDSAANKVVCFRDVNRSKRKRTPHEAFSSDAKWPEIAANALGLPRNKRWRFAHGAMERFESEERNFLARQLNETRHLSRMARIYLQRACHPDRVYVTTGQMTAMLRRRWGLNSIFRDHNRQSEGSGDEGGAKTAKVRDDHRHHAVDACVIGAIDRSLLQEMARRAGQAESEGRERVVMEAADEAGPFPGFRNAVRAAIDKLIVSVKPEHGRGGALHEETAYGLVENEAEAKEIGNLVFRKALVDLTANEIDGVRDTLLRQQLQKVTAPFRDSKGRVSKDNEKALAQALAAFAKQKAPGREQGVRRVRIGKTKTGEVPVRDRRTGAVYKALLPGENHHIDVVQKRDGSWQGFAATVFEVNQKGWRPRWEVDKLGGKLVMRLHKGDTIEVEDADGVRRIKTVHRLSPSNGVLYLAPHNEGGALAKRHDDKEVILPL